MAQTSDNTRIAKNTMFLYFRMILIMIVNLYTSRVILMSLGVEDYGIYNVVGGIVTMFSFLNGSMASSTQRYLTYELGNGNLEKLKKIFSTSLNIHLFLSCLIIVLAETLGLLFLNYKLNIPYDRMFAANVVYQFSILTFFINIIQVPYNAALIAHEKMGIYAYISILEVMLKLFVAYVISYTGIDKLIMYSGLIFFVQLLIRFIYQLYCKRNYAECRFRITKDVNLYKEMTSFAGWNLFGSMAWICRDQGVNIVVNLFFGPVVNAARAISGQVSGAVMGFISNFQTALNPQITKLYAAGERNKMEMLVFNGIKFSFCLLFLIAFPLAINITYVLELWLKVVPDYVGGFVIFILIDSLCSTLYGNPLMTSLAATGKIKNYQIFVSLCVLMTLPSVYLLLKFGGNPYSIFIAIILWTNFAGILRFYYCNKQIGFRWKSFFVNVILPVVKMLALSLPIPLYIRRCFHGTNSFGVTFFLGLISFCISLLVCWCVVLNKEEKKFIVGKLRTKCQNE